VSIFVSVFALSLHLAATLESRKDRIDGQHLYKEGWKKLHPRRGTAEPPQAREPSKQQ
jgi:hypothetical protein